MQCGVNKLVKENMPQQLYNFLIFCSPVFLKETQYLITKWIYLFYKEQNVKEYRTYGKRSYIVPKVCLWYSNAIGVIPKGFLRDKNIRP